MCEFRYRNKSIAVESVFTLHGTILVADDAPDYLQRMARTLKKEGHSVLEATDGASALEILIDTKVDLIITVLIRKFDQLI